MRLEVWDGDDSLVLELVKRGPKMDFRQVWVEFTISRSVVGSQGMQEDPIVEGVVTAGRQEFDTLGMYDGDLGLLNMALIRAYAEARRLLEEK